MSKEAMELWGRALRSLRTARGLVEEDPDASASRAYYAAFYAVSAFFALGGRTFGKHSAVLAAVHRDLVKSGKVSAEVGGAYTWLVDMRNTGDYGGIDHVDPDEAKDAVGKARMVLDAVRGISPEPLPDVDS